MSDALVNIEAERMALGAVLQGDVEAMNELAAILEPKNFADEKHKAAWEACLSLYERSQRLDLVTVRNELGERVGAAGGPAYLAGLIDGVPKITNPRQWGLIILERAQRRAAVYVAERAIAEARAGEAETAEILEKLHSQLARIISSRNDGVISIREVLPKALQRMEEFATSKSGLLGIPCGLPDVDKVIGGWQRGALYIIAARPGRGKSVFCTQSAINAGLKGKRVLVFSMEMPPEETVQRMLCSHAGVDKWDLRSRSGSEKVATGAWDSIARSAGVLAGLGIHFDRRETPTISQIRATARQHQASKGCDLLIVDYIQRCAKPAGVDGWVAVGQIVEGLKTLALALQIPVLAACQVNAEGEERRPHMGMLAEARGKISAEADMIAFLHPEQPEQWKQHDFPGMLFCIDKHRNGATMDITLSFEKPNNRFVCQPLGIELAAGRGRLS